MQKIKQRFVPFTLENNPQEDFAALLSKVGESFIKTGQVVKGQVVGVDNKVIIIDVGLKNEGRIPKEEFGGHLPSVGEIVEVYVEKLEGRNGTVLSRERARREESWVDLEVAHAEGKCVDGIIFGRVKGGFTVDVSGVVAFLPGSQVDVKPVRDITPLMGINMPFHILKMDKKLGNIIVSRRSILEESRSEARDEMLANINEGMVLEGVVKNITDYGAFIDLGSVDGLLHVTDIAWSRINHPSEILSLGQKVKVMVIKFQQDSKRISLGMKQLDDNPWQSIKQEFPVDKIFTGKISNIADYGAFIELKNGIEGLVHSSEISWVRSNQHPKKLLNIGQEVQFKVLDIDTEKHRISLSIKQCHENPLIKFAENNPVGSVVTVPVRNITDFGMFVAIGDNLDGMIHESDISWDDRGIELLKSYNKGDIITCKVLSIDIDKERIGLGIKQLNEAAEAPEGEGKFKKNAIVNCIVTAIKDDGIEVSVDDMTGIIKKADLSADKEDQRSDKFSVNDEVTAKIVAINTTARRLNLSIKAVELDDRKKVMKEYGTSESSASISDIVDNALNER